MSNVLTLLFLIFLQIRSNFAEKLLKIVRETDHHMRKTDKSQAAQDNVNKGHPALEFIKHVCAVLILDQNVQHDIRVMTVQEFLIGYFIIIMGYLVIIIYYVLFN